MAGNMFSGFIQAGQNRSDAIGQGIGALAQGYQNKKAAEANAQKQQQAMQLLDQASQLSDTDPQASQQAFMQAIQIAPDFVSQVTGMMKQRREAMTAGQPKQMTPYQAESLRLREMEAALKAEDNSLRREKLKQDIELQKAKVEKTQQEITQEQADIDESNSQAVMEMKDTISLLDRMIDHPGRESATGASSIMAKIPGSQARGFAAILETLKGRQFLDAVQNMRGLGQLSNAEGEKLAAAAASLDLGMPENEFLAELKRIKSSFEKALKTKPGTYGNDKSEIGAGSQSQKQQSETVISWDSM